MKKGMKKILSIMLMGTLLVAGCSNSSGEGKTLKVAIEKTFTTLSSHLTTTLAEMDVIGQFTEGLMGYNEAGELAPLGAESYTKSDDGLTYTFKLREDVLWKNGEKVTAQDYVYSWQRLAMDGSFKHNATMFKNGTAILAGSAAVETLGVEAKDDYTLVATLENPDNSFVQYLSSPGFFPLHQETYEASGGKDGYGSGPDTIMSNGPYELTEYVVGTKLVLKKSANYWDAKNVEIDTVEINVVSELSTQKVMFDSGDLDFVRVQGELVDVFTDKSAQKSDTQNRMLYMYLSGTTSTDSAILSNANFRKAIAYGFDREMITDNIAKDGSKPLYGLFPRGFVEIDGKDYRDIAGTYNDNNFDVAKANEYLTKAKQELGMDSITFKFAVQDMVLYKKVFDNMKSQIETNLPGVTMELETMPNQIFFPEIMKKSTPAAMATWGGGTIDFYNFAQLFSEDTIYNYGNYQSVAYNNKIEEARVEVDPIKQAELYSEAEQMLIEDASFIPIYQLGQTYNLSPKIKTFIIQPSLPAIQYKYVKKDN